MKNLTNLVVWVALYFLRCPYERIEIYRRFRPQPVATAHWVGGYAPQPHYRLRPITLLLPVLLTEALLVISVTLLAPPNALAFGFIGHLVLVAVVMSPAMLKFQSNER